MLFREREKTKLKFSDLQEKTLRDIADVAKFEAKLLLDNELDFYDYYGFSEMANVYNQLIGLTEKLEDGEFMLQIGWGTGYNANTVTDVYTGGDDPDLDIMRVRKRYRLGRSHSESGKYDEREFPKTRRILYRGQNPAAPLGWGKISPVQD